MIEALDRGVHAMIPECSMIRIYKTIDRLYRSGNREGAKRVFGRLLPVLCFTNQELDVSIRFFKRLLCRKGIFATSRDRLKSPPFDSYSCEIADELVNCVLGLENDLRLTQT
jgi:4-hydroxy-tetrahydrodipicolinate synthase